MILCEKRNQLKKFLEQNNIETKIHYPIPLHKQSAFTKIFGRKKIIWLLFAKIVEK